MRIFIPEICLQKSPMTKKQQRIIIQTMLMKINLPIKRSKVVEINIKGLGIIHTHRNRKKTGKLKYLRGYNKKKHKIKMTDKQQDINYILF